jgi:hypothetical protein
MENAARTWLPQARSGMGAAGLVTAAAVYPAARQHGWVSLASARELASVAAAAGLASRAHGRGGTTARAMIAAGWAAHALFDAKHDAGSGGRLPRWYPALCAGYDLAFAAALLRPAVRAGQGLSRTPGRGSVPPSPTRRCPPRRTPPSPS